MKKRTEHDINEISRENIQTVLLALSTFRYSNAAVDLAINKAAKSKLLIILIVTDVNLERYLIDSDVWISRDLGERCKKELLKEYEEKNREIATSIAEKTESIGIKTMIYLRTGRFALESLKIVQDEKPDIIITTRSKRPSWLRFLFGSPVDHLIDKAQCPVIEA